MGKIHDDNERSIVDMYITGNKVDCIADTLGVTDDFVVRTLRNKGITLYNYEIVSNEEEELKIELNPFDKRCNKGKRILSSNEVYKIVELYNSGMDIKYLADKYKISIKTLKNVLNDEGIEIYNSDINIRRDKSNIRRDKSSKIISMYKAGMSVRDIGLSTETSESTIRGMLKRAGVEFKSNRTGAETVNEIIRMHNEGVASSDIAKELNVSISSVLTIVNKLRGCKK